MPEQEEITNIEAVSGVNARGEGFVHIALMHRDKRAVIQATPAEARNISRQIAEAAEAAETDSFLFQFLKDKIGAQVEQVGAVLLEFRAFRELSGGVKNRDQNDPHWQEMDRKNKESRTDDKTKPDAADGLD